jgi:hypothetical protein
VDNLPDRPPVGTPTITRKIAQPQDEAPDTYIKDGRLVSKNPTEPKQRAEFAVERIVQTFDSRPLFQVLNEFVEKNDLDGFIKCWENCTLDIKTLERHVFITLRPGQ